MGIIYKAALWDMDGTLFYTRPGIERALRETCLDLGLEAIREEELETFIGPPVQDSMMRYYGMGREEAIKSAEHFRSIYHGEGYSMDCEPYPGIVEALRELKENGVGLAVATLKKEPMAKKICEKYGLSPLMDCVYGTDPADKLKKHDIIALCCRHFGIEDFSEALMIGDSKYDAMGAEKAGTPFLAVSYGFGFHPGDDLSEYKPIGVAASPKDIVGFFLSAG